MLDRVVGYFSPRMGLRRASDRVRIQQLRSYSAAEKTRRTENWLTRNQSANVTISHSLRELVNRSRDLIRNTPWGARGISVIANNTVGTGISSEVKRASNKAKLQNVNRRWQQHAYLSTSIDYNGRHNLDGLAHMVMSEVPAGGECLAIRRIVGGELKVQILEGSHLDVSKTVDLESGNRIVAGVELDANDRVVAYWIYPKHPGDSYTLQRSERFLAEDVAHIFRGGRPGQVRDVPWLTPAMMTLRDLDDYEDAYLLRNKLANCITAFVYGKETPADGDGVRPELAETLEPGSIFELADGSDVRFSEPPGTDSYGPYVQQQLYRVAVALGITHESLTGNLKDVNFSSGRMGWLEMHRNIEVWRWQMLIPQFLNRVAQWWFEVEELSGRLATNVYMEWTPPKREIFNPSQEISSLKDQIRSGLISQPEAIRSLGYDPETIIEETREFQQLAVQAELQFDSLPSQDAARQTAQARSEST